MNTSHPSLEPSLFESLKRYVGFTDQSTAALRELHPIAAPHFGAIVDDFYAAIDADPAARAAISGGEARIARLKSTLVRWLDTMLTGPHDEGYFEMRARIGRVHVRIDLPQAYMFTAVNRIRIQLLDVTREYLARRPDEARRLTTALHQILDLELAIMLETYRQDLLAKNRNAERLATIGQFTASIGHELRNPLATIESSLFLLRKHLGSTAATNADVAKHLDRIGGEVARSNKTIDDVLELVRNRPPSRSRVLMRAVVESSISRAALPPGVEVSVAVPPNLAVSADADQLQQVLVNLLVNASQAMNGAGGITLDGESSEDGARLRVWDNGPGVPAEVRYRIFEALFTTKTKGSGLGLALCRRIIGAHGGTIELEPSTCGATFVIWLPTPRAPALSDARR